MSERYRFAEPLAAQGLKKKLNSGGTKCHHGSAELKGGSFNLV